MSRSRTLTATGTLGLCLAGVAALWVFTAQAADNSPSAAAKPYRVGVHFYQEGKIYDEAYAGIRDGLKLERIPYEEVIIRSDRDDKLAAENLRKLDGMSLDLIYSLSSAGTVIAKEIGMKTPVISTVINHPVTLGVKGTEDDGRIKLTGTSYYVDAAKQLELYRSLFPAIKKVGMIFDATNPAGFLAEEPFMREACEEAKLPFASVGVKAKGELQEATRKLVEEGVGVIVIPTNRLVYENLQEVTTLAHGKGVPVVSLNKQAVENGAIAALFADTYNLGRLTAGMARRILVEQAKPSQIGFQYIPEPEIILNLNSAQELQYEFPPEILSSAAIVVQ